MRLNLAGGILAAVVLVALLLSKAVRPAAIEGAERSSARV